MKNARTKRPLFFDYKVYGLSLRSDRLLPNLLCAEFEVPDVVIQTGTVPFVWDDATVSGPNWSASETSFLLSVPDVARFFISQGTQITLEPVGGASDNAINAFLMGGVFAALFHQRHQVVLHGGAVEIGGKAIVIAGSSGAGKSTTTGYFIKNGGRLIADDLSVLTVGSHVSVASSFPYSKLTGESLEKLGTSSQGLELLNADRNKFLVPRSAEFEAGSHRLTAIFALRKSDVNTVQISRMTPARALKTIQRRTFRKRFLLPDQYQALVLKWAKVACQVPHFDVVRPAKYDTVDVVANEMKAKIASLE